VSSHPLEIFLVIIAGFLFGILGMIAAVPLYTILKVIGKIFPENKVIQLLTKIFNLDLTILNSEIQNL
jgi:predicted PurR-regulated permease PerM